MNHIHWVARQNKLEIPNDEEEVNTREIHKCDGQAHDPDTMVDPLTFLVSRQLVYFQQNKKRRNPKVKIVTLQLCEVKKKPIDLTVYEKRVFKLPFSSPISLFSAELQKRRKAKVKIVTLQLCQVKKSQYICYEKVPTCAA
jgi:hypothetical protein